MTLKRHITFQNERGRRIRLEVRKHLLEDETKAITYTLTGPYSTTEQTMTRLEAHLVASLIAEQMGYRLIERELAPPQKALQRVRRLRHARHSRRAL